MIQLVVQNFKLHFELERLLIETVLVCYLLLLFFYWFAAILILIWCWSLTETWFLIPKAVDLMKGMSSTMWKSWSCVDLNFGTLNLIMDPNRFLWISYKIFWFRVCFIFCLRCASSLWLMYWNWCTWNWFAGSARGFLCSVISHDGQLQLPMCIDKPYPKELETFSKLFSSENLIVLILQDLCWRMNDWIKFGFCCCVFLTNSGLSLESRKISMYSASRCWIFGIVHATSGNPNLTRIHFLCVPSARLSISGAPMIWDVQ